jgi:hypothetical protein
MTLNITIMTRDRIYQSSDFRLTEQPGGRVVTDSSTKAIVIQNNEFYGLLTYTGTGRWNGKDTRDWIIEWLEAIGDISVEEVTEKLGEKAAKWIASVSRGRSELLPLTMILATFDARASGARRTVISNFEDAFGRETWPPSTDFQVSTVEATQAPSVLITGSSQLRV